MASTENWNFGDIFEALDEVMPADAPALIHDGRTLEWADFAERTNNLARSLVERGANPDDKIAIYTRNCAEYLETLVAAFKARLVHVNVNFRYLDDELAYILEWVAITLIVGGSFVYNQTFDINIYSYMFCLYSGMIVAESSRLSTQKKLS